MSEVGYLLVNFGGPRTLSEVEPFLRALLTDKDVVRTKFPQPIHNLLFNRIAKKRAKKVSHDYDEIGGGSPIFADTEYVAEELRKRLDAPVFTFHRYLPETHAASLAAIEKFAHPEIRVFPMFPQFTYATTGSIARFFQEKLIPTARKKLKWCKSYPTHPAFAGVFQKIIREFLEEKQLAEEDVVLLFSAHGIPRSFVDTGDLYEYECRASFQKVMEAFPEALGRLCFQSKFGPGEWLRPYTQDACEEIELWNEGRKHVLFIPISFTSDHIETLFEIEREYLPLITQKGLEAYRLPAPNRRDDWIAAIVSILLEFVPTSSCMLVRGTCARNCCPK
ncbi:MAG: Ferrochelatase [Chlamydiae bacterium]|nr:Ferrochelatase [Chlamydiota bacterium]